MYLMQQLEKLFNETTLRANVARPRRFCIVKFYSTELRRYYTSRCSFFTKCGDRKLHSSTSPHRPRTPRFAFKSLHDLEWYRTNRQPARCNSRNPAGDNDKPLTPQQVPCTKVRANPKTNEKDSYSSWSKKFSSLAAVETVCFLENLYCACTIFHMILFPSVS